MPYNIFKEGMWRVQGVWGDRGRQKEKHMRVWPLCRHSVFWPEPKTDFGEQLLKRHLLFQLKVGY